MIHLPQNQADELFNMKKYCIDDTTHEFPELGGVLRIPLRSKDAKEEFLLDISRRSIRLEKNKFQIRSRISLILARIDIGGAPHRNPDGEEISCPHIHLYREGYDDKWAFPLPTIFSNPSDIWQTLQEFMEYCHIIQTPHIQKGLFV